MASMAVTDFPEPDSPTTPTISPRSISSETWFSAWTHRENREAQVQIFNGKTDSLITVSS
jgi:hypothetical protein